MTSARDFDDRYIEALAFPESNRDSAKVAREAALERAHKLRQFEIENYWKRATYFWAFQLAAFTLLGLIFREVGASLRREVLLIPGAIGALTAQVGWLAAMGSKFWQENWEAHVDMLEEDQEGRLTQVIFAKNGPQFSVSRINEKLFFLLMVGWLALFTLVLFPPLEIWLGQFVHWLVGLGLALAMVYIWAGSRTRLRGCVFYREGEDWDTYRPPSLPSRLRSKATTLLGGKSRQPALILRDTLSGSPERPAPRSIKGPKP